MRRHEAGFTIVELLIVIVVIGILAAITIVAYNGVQGRARDSKRVSDMNTLAKSMTMWSIQTGESPAEIKAGYNNSGRGWIYASGYSSNITTILQEAGLLSEGVHDPVYKTGSGSYMFYPCKTGDTRGPYAFFAHLDAPDNTSNDLSRWQAEGCQAGAIDVYNVNYVKMFSV